MIAKMTESGDLESIQGLNPSAMAMVGRRSLLLLIYLIPINGSSQP
jgi:hypothetical protein